MDTELDRLLHEVEAAETAYREHLRSGVPVLRGDAVPSGQIVPISTEWMEQHEGLRAALVRADEAWLNGLHSAVRR